MNTTLASAPSTLDTPAVQAAPRFDLYSTIHKALRHFMGDTLYRVGRLDVDDAADMEGTLGQLDSLLGLCLSHIHHENEFVHSAIEARHPAGAERTAGDHAEHLDSIEALQSEARALRETDAAARPVLAQRLYAHLALFVAENLQHLHIEETANNGALWALYSDAELLQIHERLLASVSPAEHQVVGRWMFPAVNPTERAAILLDIKSKTPPEPFLGLVAMLRGLLDDKAWNALARAVGVSPYFAVGSGTPA